MTHVEGAHERPRTEAGAFRAAEYKEDREKGIERLAEQYKNIQAQLITLREGLKKGTEYTVQQNNPGIEELALKIRQTIQAQVENLEIEKEELEKSIRGKGGNLSDYTVQ